VCIMITLLPVSVHLRNKIGCRIPAEMYRLKLNLKIASGCQPFIFGFSLKKVYRQLVHSSYKHWIRHVVYYVFFSELA